MKNRSGLHIWSVSWPLASRGTHPVVSDSASLENYPLRAGAVFVYVRVDLKWHLSLSGWCCYLVLSPHGTWLPEVRYISHFRGCLDYERNLVIPRLVGSNSSSWGWCLKTLKVYHDSRKYRHGVSYPRYFKHERNQIEQHRF